MPPRKARLGAGDLILNTPFAEPSRSWSYDRKHMVFTQIEGRRPAGYIVATPDAQGFNDPGQFIELQLVNQIRPRINLSQSNRICRSPKRIYCSRLPNYPFNPHFAVSISNESSFGSTERRSSRTASASMRPQIAGTLMRSLRERVWADIVPDRSAIATDGI